MTGSGTPAPAPCDLLIRCGVLVTQDGARRVIEDAGIAVLGGAVLAVDGFDLVAATHAPRERLDLSPCLVLPGLINAHTHASMTIFRGIADDLPLMEWLRKHIFPVEKHLTRDIVHLGALLACAEMLRTGTTCFCDMYLLERDVFRAVRDAGMRSVVAEGVFVFPSPAYGTVDQALELVDELIALCAEEPRLRTALMPHAVYTTTPEILKRTHAKARENGLIWKIHFAETEDEARYCLEQFGKRPTAYLDDLGVLDDHAVLAHGVDLNEEEVELLARRGVSVAHNPISNLKLGSGIAPVADLRRRGLNVCLGTDGAASNNDLNMFTEMRVAALLQKGARKDPTLLPAQDVLDMATVNGAAALDWPEIGALASGCRCDLTALTLDEPNLIPLYNPVSHAVYAANGGDVVLTMVEGKTCYREGEYLTLDYPLLRREMKRIAKWVLERAVG